MEHQKLWIRWRRINVRHKPNFAGKVIVAGALSRSLSCAYLCWKSFLTLAVLVWYVLTRSPTGLSHCHRPMSWHYEDSFFSGFVLMFPRRSQTDSIIKSANKAVRKNVPISHLSLTSCLSWFHRRQPIFHKHFRWPSNLLVHSYSLQ
jgi:hypothetical protein